VFGFNLEKFEQITRIPAGRVDSRLDPGGLESMSMSLLQRTISESQIWPTSNTELPAKRSQSAQSKGDRLID